jgi:thiol-disulfide isomerase/thioredoxin/predicted nucleic acid-binding protein
MGKKAIVASALVGGLFLLSPVSLRVVPAAQEPVTHSAGPPEAAATPSPAEQESQALQDAVRSSENNPQVLIKNLEGFLEQFPASTRREQVLDFIYKSAVRANDPQTAIEYGEKLLGLKPDDPALLSSLVDLLERQDDASSRAKALQYATKFVELAERKTKESAASAANKEEAPASPTFMLAAAYLTRAKLYAASGEADRAVADYEKSYAAYPSQQVAERLGDLAAKKNDLKRAVDEYATAFAFPGPGLDPSHREEVRRKLGSCYLALHSSENGLGDLVLARYDELVHTLAPRFQDSRQPNANLRDPFAYVLKRTDGSLLPLADYRGKVLVLEFWATWCGPCRLEGRLLERVTENFRNQPAAVFLAVNVDEDRASVPTFVKQEEWTTPVVYAQGLDRLLGVQALPTLLIFDRHGRVVFRQEGLDVSSFVETLDRKVREALGQSDQLGRFGADPWVSLLAGATPSPTSIVAPETEALTRGLAFRRKNILCYTSQNVAEFWSTYTRPVDQNGFGLSPQEADRRARAFESKLQLLPDSIAVHQEWRALIVTHNVSGARVHDARLVASMRVYGVKRILTFNERDFARYADIQAMHPRALLADHQR